MLEPSIMKWLVDNHIVDIDPADRAKLPPHDEDAEGAALGCIFLSPTDCAPQIAKFGLNRWSFYCLAHQTIFDCIVRLVAEGKTPDLLTVAGRLRDDGMMEKAGGLALLSGLPDKTPSSMMFEQYVDRLNVLRRRREIMQHASCLISR